MRQAYKVWLGIAAGLFLVVAAVDLGSAARSTPAAAGVSAPLSTPARTTTTPSVPTYAAAPASTAPTSTAQPGETVTVTEVIDGDTLAVTGNRRVRLLGIDACDTSTRGGREAKGLLEGFVDGQQVRLVADGARDRDGSGRLLRRAETATGATDLGELMVVYPTVGIAEGRNDAAPAYLSELRAADYGERDCSGTPAVSESPGGGDVDVDVDVGDGDGGLPDGALTGGYCARKWWC